MTLRIDMHSMALEVSGREIATARFAWHAAADGQGAWIVSDRPGRLFTRDQAITALTVTELLAIGHSSDHGLVLAFEEELRWPIRSSASPPNLISRKIIYSSGRPLNRSQLNCSRLAIRRQGPVCTCITHTSLALAFAYQTKGCELNQDRAEVVASDADFQMLKIAVGNGQLVSFLGFTDDILNAVEVVSSGQIGIHPPSQKSLFAFL